MSFVYAGIFAPGSLVLATEEGGLEAAADATVTILNVDSDVPTYYTDRSKSTTTSPSLTTDANGNWGPFFVEPGSGYSYTVVDAAGHSHGPYYFTVNTDPEEPTVQGPNASISLATIPGGLALSIGQTQDFTVDVVALSGTLYESVSSAPCLIGPTSTVVSAPVAAVNNLDTSNDGFDLVATLIVTDQLGTNVISVVVNGTVAESGPGASLALDWTTASATALVGSDLAWDGTSIVSSTAGGIFTASLILGGSWS